MGRHAGWIALHSGLAGGADLVLVPEFPVELDAVVESLRRRHRRARFSIVVVAEGAQIRGPDGKLGLVARGNDVFGRPLLGGVGQVLATELEARLGIETRVTVLGHVQRGGSPTAHDRVIATRFGVAAVDFVNEGRSGVLTGLRGTEIEPVPLSIVSTGLKTVRPELYEVAKTFFD